MVRARQLGMLTYRGRDELDTRFGKVLPHLDRPPVAEYLDHHGKRFAERFPEKTFLLLSEAIDRESFGDADAIREACAKVTAETIVSACPATCCSRGAAGRIASRAAGRRSGFFAVEARIALRHDAFLADQEKLADLLRGAAAFGVPLKTAARPRFEGVGLEPVREIRIGLVGCGTVGRGLLEMIDRQSSAVAERYGVKFRVSRIAVRDVTKDRGPRVTGIPDHRSRPRARERSGSRCRGRSCRRHRRRADPARRAAAGKPVVTANKELLASKLAELGVLAHRTETPLYCEAAAAAAIPIVRHLSHRADEIDSLWGIINATCNFVMTRLEQGDLTLDEAIAEAQRLGFAEADPSADLDGLDAAAKLSILAYRAFGAWVRPDGFLVRGIREIDPADCDLAESMGFRIRQIARAVRFNGALDRRSSRCCCRPGNLLASSRRSTTPSICAACRQAT
jgi:homoserine dehydrogenase